MCCSGIGRLATAATRPARPRPTPAPSWAPAAPAPPTQRSSCEGLGSQQGLRGVIIAAPPLSQRGRIRYRLQAPCLTACKLLRALTEAPVFCFPNLPTRSNCADIRILPAGSSTASPPPSSGSGSPPPPTSSGGPPDASPPPSPPAPALQPPLPAALSSPPPRPSPNPPTPSPPSPRPSPTPPKPSPPPPRPSPTPPRPRPPLPRPSPPPSPVVRPPPPSPARALPPMPPGAAPPAAATFCAGKAPGFYADTLRQDNCICVPVECTLAQRILQQTGCQLTAHPAPHALPLGWLHTTPPPPPTTIHNTPTLTHACALLQWLQRLLPLRDLWILVL